jgi:synaptobrevin family protein YKT6
MYIDTITSDVSLTIPKFSEFIKTYQDPREVDKLLKIENTLNEVNQIVHKSLDDVKYNNIII